MGLINAGWIELEKTIRKNLYIFIFDEKPPKLTGTGRYLHLFPKYPIRDNMDKNLNKFIIPALNVWAFNSDGSTITLAVYVKCHHTISLRLRPTIHPSVLEFKITYGLDLSLLIRMLQFAYKPFWQAQKQTPFIFVRTLLSKVYTF